MECEKPKEGKEWEDEGYSLDCSFGQILWLCHGSMFCHFFCPVSTLVLNSCIFLKLTLHHFFFLRSSSQNTHRYISKIISRQDYRCSDCLGHASPIWSACSSNQKRRQSCIFPLLQLDGWYIQSEWLAPPCFELEIWKLIAIVYCLRGWLADLEFELYILRNRYWPHQEFSSSGFGIFQFKSATELEIE